MMNNDIFIIFFMFVFYNMYFFVKSCNNGIVNIYFDIKFVVYFFLMGIERRCNMGIWSRYMEVG